ncbi:Protein cbp3, mitochondrial [Agyrium rufum]|nr:Protein cbp3, mitochondrial [Agyrium rufum]
MQSCTSCLRLSKQRSLSAQLGQLSSPRHNAALQARNHSQSSFTYQTTPAIPKQKSRRTFTTAIPLLQQSSDAPIKPYKPSSTASSSSSALKPQSPSQSPQPTQQQHQTTTQRLAGEVRNLAPSFTETYVAYGATELLVKECARHAEYTIPQAADLNIELPKTKDGEDLGVGKGWWYEELGLTPTFNTWAQITFLHMYLLTVRLRAFPPEHATAWHQHVIDHFSYLAEDRMVVMHRLNARFIRNKFLKDLFVQWRGCMAGYDEGLIEGDAVLATAVWRNIFKADPNFNVQGLAQIVAYMRSCMQELEKIDDRAIAQGEVVFGDPKEQAKLVRVRSKGIDEPFDDARPEAVS